LAIESIQIVRLPARQRQQPPRAFTIARGLRGSSVPQFQDTYGWILGRLSVWINGMTWSQRMSAHRPGAHRVNDEARLGSRICREEHVDGV
jgi:hypothetical protein